MARTGYHLACGYEHESGKCPIDRVKKYTEAAMIRVDAHKVIKENTSLKELETMHEKLGKDKNIAESKKGKLEDYVRSRKVDYGARKAIATTVITAGFAIYLVFSGVMTGEHVIRDFILAISICGIVIGAIATYWFDDSANERNKEIKLHLTEELDKIDKLTEHIANLVSVEEELVSKIAVKKRQQRDFWIKMNGWQFEKEVASVFARSGYDARVTRGSGDGGIDINLYKNSERTIVQCKNHKAVVGPSPIRDLHGALVSSGAKNAIMVSQTGFTIGAKNYAMANNIRLMDLNDIINLYSK